MSAAYWTEQTLSGHLPPDAAGDYHLVPFEMPPGVDRLEVRYGYDAAIGSDPGLTGGNTLDIGLFDERGAAYPGPGFRGWSGSAREVFAIGPDDATPGYLPGPLNPGRWHILLGFYKSAPEGCHYTITLRFHHAEALPRATFPPMLTLANSPASLPARPDGWYRGELHCHSCHSDGDADPCELVAAARALGLDFLAVMDHNAMSHLAALAALDPGPLTLIPGCEVTTYKGHWNIWGLEEWIDFRTLTPDRMRQSIERANALGYLTSCNHPRTMGPPWEFQAEAGQSCVEVWNGPWQLFNAEALAWWEDRLRAGERLVAVGGSDAHYLKRPHIAQIGTPTTWIHCSGQPTAAGLLAGLRAGHAFISDAPDGPQVYLSGGGAMMGDTLPRPAAGGLVVQTRVVGGARLRMELIGGQGLLAQADITRDDQTLTFAVAVGGTPYVRAQLVEPGTDPAVMRALSNPIFIQ